MLRCLWVHARIFSWIFRRHVQKRWRWLRFAEWCGDSDKWWFLLSRFVVHTTNSTIDILHFRKESQQERIVTVRNKNIPRGTWSGILFTPSNAFSQSFREGSSFSRLTISNFIISFAFSPFLYQRSGCIQLESEREISEEKCCWQCYQQKCKTVVNISIAVILHIIGSSYLDMTTDSTTTFISISRIRLCTLPGESRPP